MSNPLQDLELSSEELKAIEKLEVLKSIKVCLKMRY